MRDSAARPDLRVALLLGQGRVAEAQALLRHAWEKPGAAAPHPELHLFATNAFRGSPGEQLTRLNTYLASYGLQPLALLSGDAPPAPGNLQAANPVVPIEGGPLATVLMTTFNTGPRVDAAIASVLGQSWRNLELIVVDDASQDDTPERVEALAARDARLRLIRLPRNAGTYVAKHVGLQHARGEFVTCHDSDDWALPSKIERQVTPLLKDRRLVATTSCWVRMRDDGVFYARQVHPLMRLNPASPLFRRELVLNEAGAWDVVRTGADSEFLERLKLVFGRKAVRRIGLPLTLGSHRPGSLMTDPETGYSASGQSTARQVYWESWSNWHACALARGAKPWLPVDPTALARQRPFEAPTELLIAADVVADCTMQSGTPGFMSARQDKARWVAASAAVARVATLPPLLGGPVVQARVGMPRQRLSAVLAWGRKPSAKRAEALSRRRGLPLHRIEDGFLRSFGTGDRFPPLSLVRDELGIYYDSTRPSALEQLLESTADFLLEDRRGEVARARELVLKHGLSKYNHAASIAGLEAQTGALLLRPGDTQRVLVVDQTAGDMSVALGGGRADTFAAMLAAALEENPQATVYVKTHPEVTSGRKAGHFSAVQTGGRVVVLRQAVEPMSLLREMDRVYVVSSTLGFEALLAGKPVTCFGIPWYGGWGATDDRQHCPRRTQQRNVDELFAAGYLHYTRYLDPMTREQGSIFTVIDWLVRQKDMASRLQGPAGPRRVICAGFRRWKAENIKAMLSLDASQVTFVPSVAAARQMVPKPGDWLLFWGGQAPAGLMELALEASAEAVRVEDGFVRSVGLGSDLIKPLSLVLDSRGIYFDPSQPSELEHLLNTATFTADELAEAAAVRRFMVANGITKYNLEPRAAPAWQPSGRKVVLVPGQVEDDASIRLGCTDVRSNLGLLQAARAACPQAYIVYKPHPDVTSGNRQGRMALDEAMQWADHVETYVSVVSCLDACDEVHTMTSLTGFDALLRGKKVVVYGQPFYAGWGLTHDVLENTGAIALARRQRRLTLDELVAGTLLRYPIYWDWELKGYTTCMAVLRQLSATRDALVSNGALNKLRSGWWRRQWRKARILARAWAGT